MVASGTLFLSVFDFYLRGTILETAILVLVPCSAFAARHETMPLPGLSSAASMLRFIPLSRLPWKFGYGVTAFGILPVGQLHCTAL